MTEPLIQIARGLVSGARAAETKITEKKTRKKKHDKKKTRKKNTTKKNKFTNYSHYSPRKLTHFFPHKMEKKR